MALIDAYRDPSSHLEVEPFPIPPTAQRSRVVGIDVWVELRSSPAQFVTDAVAALRSTPVRLASHQVIEEHRVRVRLVARDQDAHLTDARILEALDALTLLGRWTLVIKLTEFDGVPAYQPLPALEGIEG